MDMGKSDTSFDSFRRERKRRQAKLGLSGSPTNYGNEALRELNAVVLSAKLRCAKQLTRHQDLINQLQNPE